MSQLDTESAKYEMRNVAQLQGWDENPRTITKDEFKRLKEHIKRLGVYKPLLINQSNLVLGGNQRLQALKDLGVEEVMCAVVLTDNKHQMIEYALSDNEQMGVTDKQKLAELVTINPVKTELFAVSTGTLKPLQAIVDAVSPSGRDNTPVSVKYQCPECGHENDPSAFRVTE